MPYLIITHSIHVTKYHMHFIYMYKYHVSIKNIERKLIVFKLITLTYTENDFETSKI